MIRWWLVRHAKVPGGRIVGRSDPECDLFAIQEVAALASWLPQEIATVHSGARRTMQTCDLLGAAGLQFTSTDCAEDLIEQDFGDWDGRSWAELAAQDSPDPELTAFWKSPGRTRPPRGESFAAVIDRVAATLPDLGYRLKGPDILAVVHAGTIRAALAHALDLDPDAALRIMVAPLSLTRIDWLSEEDTGGAPAWRVVGVNRVPP